MEQDVADLLRQREFGVSELKVFRDVSARGTLAFFLQLTRSRFYVALLSRVLNKPAPPKYRLRYGVICDAIIEITFDGIPSSERIDEVLKVLRATVRSTGECVVLKSLKQYTVYDARSSRALAKRVNICFLVNRPSTMDRDTCQAYWRTKHAELAINNMKYMALSRYLQVHTAASPGEKFDDEYDGVVYAEKPSVASLIFELLKLDVFRFNNTIVMDETNFTECTPIMLMRLSKQWQATA